jgi:hypothetical protein
VLRVKELRDEARHLRAMAAGETDSRVGAELLDLAERYESLAKQREDFLELQEEIRAKKNDVTDRLTSN